MIQVLMISTDPKILEEGSNVRMRMQEYGTLFSELHIILFSQEVKVHASCKISGNTFVHPTYSQSKFSCIADAKAIGLSIIKEKNFKPGESVITTQDPFETGLVGKFLSRKSGIALHVQLHTDYQSPYFRHGFLNKIRVFISPPILHQAKVIRTVSDRISLSLPKQFRRKAEVLPIFADTQVIKNASVTVDLRKKYPQFTKIILSASRLTEEKDLITAIRAFKESYKKNLGIGFIIVGSGKEESRLKKEVSRLGLEKSVIFESWISPSTLISYMKTSDIFFSTSLYEGYGLSMLEAHTAGALLVSTNAGIAPLLTSEELLVNPRDQKGMSEALTKALSGSFSNRAYIYPYSSRQVYNEAFKKSIERALL